MSLICSHKGQRKRSMDASWNSVTPMFGQGTIDVLQLEQLLRRIGQPVRRRGLRWTGRESLCSVPCPFSMSSSGDKKC